MYLATLTVTNAAFWSVSEGVPPSAAAATVGATVIFGISKDYRCDNACYNYALTYTKVIIA